MRITSGMNSQTGGKPIKGWSSAWGLGEEQTVFHRIIPVLYEMLHRTSEFAGYCEQGNEPSGSTKGWEIFGQMSDCWLLK
jgi:hypothetical protein